MSTPSNQAQRRFLADTKPKSVNVEARTVDFSFSSEEPVLRFDWQIGEFHEVLDHGPGFDLSRMQGGPFLWAHDQRDQRGAIDRAYIGNDRKGRATARLSRNPGGEELLTDMADGIVRGISFAYEPSNWREEGTAPDGRPIMRAMTTKVLEISAVSVPADTSIGIGRSLETSTQRSQNMETKEAQDLDRAVNIRALGEVFGCEKLAKQLIASGASVEQAREAILSDSTKNRTNDIQTGTGMDDLLGLSEKEQKQYSLCRAITDLAYPTRGRGNSLEQECSDEIAKRLGKKTDGLFVPGRDLMTRQIDERTMSQVREALAIGDSAGAQRALRAQYLAGTNAQGGFTVETQIQPLIDLLRNMAQVMDMGATMITGLQGNIQFPRQNLAGQTFWLAEGGNITETEGTFDTVSMSPKTVGGLQQYSRQLLIQSTLDIEGFIRQDLLSILALAIDLAAISGTGTGNQPIGIVNTSGIGSVAMGANGAAFSNFDQLIDLRTAVASKNALSMSSPGYLLNSKTVGNLAKLKNTVGEYLWVGDGGGPADGIPSAIMGMKWAETNQLRSNLTKGTGTNLSELIFGDWSSLLIGQWSGLEILANPFADSVFKNGGVLVRGLASVDIAVRHPESFGVISDLVTS